MAISEDGKNVLELISQLGKVIDEWPQARIDHDEEAFRRCRDEYRAS